MIRRAEPTPSLLHPVPDRAASLAARAALVSLMLALALLPEPVRAQDGLPSFQDEILGQFDASARKLVALAEAMPEESFDWQPAPGVYTVARVYAHITRYNYMYPDQNLGLDVPAAYQDFESELTGKGEVVAELTRSVGYVRATIEGMSEADLGAATTLYGRDVAKAAVLLQLVTHMNEHLGQAIAYARMNGVVPPWSR